MDKIYLRKHGDHSNAIEIDENAIKIAVNGNKNWFVKSQIETVSLKSIYSMPALIAGILEGIMGARLIYQVPILGMLLILTGAFAFYYGMEWHQRLEINLNTNQTLKIIFFYRSVGDIKNILTKHGYIK